MTSLFHTAAWILLVAGWLLTFLGSLWIIVLAWQRSVLWGVICVLVPIVQIVYVAMHVKESKQAFFLQIAGLILVVLASLAGVPGS